VTVTFDNFNFYILIDSAKSEQIETLIVGG
jgi:hypothetical protein